MGYWARSSLGRKSLLSKSTSKLASKSHMSIALPRSHSLPRFSTKATARTYAGSGATRDLSKTYPTPEALENFVAGCPSIPVLISLSEDEITVSLQARSLCTLVTYHLGFSLFQTMKNCLLFAKVYLN